MIYSPARPCQGDLHPLTMSYIATLKQKTYLTPDILELHFEKPADFIYQAGQFVQWTVPDGTSGRILRPFSLSSAPADDELEFLLKVLPDGRASTYAANLRIGDNLRLEEPKGKFIIETAKPHLYFIATGAGLAPIMAMMRDELQNKKTDAEVRLLFGVRSEDDIFWADRLESLRSRYTNFSYTITLSQPKPNNGWSGLRGRVTDHVLHHLVNHQFFLCGNAAMVKDMRQLLIGNGIEAAQIHFEIF